MSSRADDFWVEAKRYSNPIRDIEPHQVVPGEKMFWSGRIPPPEETAGGLLLPGNTADEKAIYVVVRSVGPEVPVNVCFPGDVVAMKPYAGDVVEFAGGREFRLSEVNQITAKLAVMPELVPADVPLDRADVTI